MNIENDNFSHTSKRLYVNLVCDRSVGGALAGRAWRIRRGNQQIGRAPRLPLARPACLSARSHAHSGQSSTLPTVVCRGTRDGEGRRRLRRRRRRPTTRGNPSQKIHRHGACIAFFPGPFSFFSSVLESSERVCVSVSLCMPPIFDVDSRGSTRNGKASSESVRWKRKMSSGRKCKTSRRNKKFASQECHLRKSKPAREKHMINVIKKR